MPFVINFFRDYCVLTTWVIKKSMIMSLTAALIMIRSEGINSSDFPTVPADYFTLSLSLGQNFEM